MEVNIIPGSLHPARRALSSDWCVNSFIMVVYEQIYLVMLYIKNSD